MQKLGRAGAAHLGQRGEEAARLYAEWSPDYPDEPGVHYAYGVFLLRSGSDKGLAELRAGSRSSGPTTRWLISRSPSSCWRAATRRGEGIGA